MLTMSPEIQMVSLSEGQPTTLAFLMGIRADST